jgi:hypothetical protein
MFAQPVGVGWAEVLVGCGVEEVGVISRVFVGSGVFVIVGAEAVISATIV